MEPSKQIANGDETLVLQLTNDKPLQGVFMGESNDAILLANAEGEALTVPKRDVEERATSPVSTLQDLTNLVAFLKARRELSAPPRN